MKLLPMPSTTPSAPTTSKDVVLQDGNAPNCSGLEARFMAEVGLASHKMKMTLTEANEWVLKLLRITKAVFTKEGGNPGLPFDQVYDLQHVSRSTSGKRCMKK